MTPLVSDFRSAVAHNNIAQALELIERFGDAPDPAANAYPDDLYALMDLAIAHERVQIVEAFARRFNTFIPLKCSFVCQKLLRMTTFICLSIFYPPLNLITLM